jgi:hypothetical protein
MGGGEEMNVGWWKEGRRVGERDMMMRVLGDCDCESIFFCLVYN